MLPDLAIDIILLTRRIVENYFRLILIDGNKKSGNTFLPGWQCYFSFHSNGGFCFSLALLSSLFSTLSWRCPTQCEKRERGEGNPMEARDYQSTSPVTWQCSRLSWSFYKTKYIVQLSPCQSFMHENFHVQGHALRRKYVHNPNNIPIYSSTTFFDGSVQQEGKGDNCLSNGTKKNGKWRAHSSLRKCSSKAAGR